MILQLQPLVPVHQFDKLPSYFIFAGLVFIPLTQPYLHEYGEDWYNTSPRRLCERALRELPKKAGEQLVILSQVLCSRIILESGSNQIYIQCWTLNSKPLGLWNGELFLPVIGGICRVGDHRLWWIVYWSWWIPPWSMVLNCIVSSSY